MRKSQLTQELAVSEKLHLSTAVKAVDGVIRIIKETLAKGEEITLRGFGTLSVVDVKERPAIHFKTKEQIIVPKTKEQIIVPAHRSVKFRLSKELKETLNDGSK